jgi:hypothetical protein
MSDGRKRLSGFQYKKIRLDKEESKNNFIQSSHKISNFFYATSTCKDKNKVNVEESDAAAKLKNTNDESEDKGSKIVNVSDNSSALAQIVVMEVSENVCNEEEVVIREVVVNNQVISDDIGLWPSSLLHAERQILIERGPNQVKICKFPVTEGRRFTVSCYKRKLPNGEEIERSWLVYSVHKDAVFCFCCKIFKPSSIKLSGEGVTNWKHVHDIISEHETSQVHFQSVQDWREFSKRLEKHATIDKKEQMIYVAETRHWKGVAERVLAIVHFLGKQCLAFRGNSDKLYTKSNGNFLTLIELIAKFDDIMSEHVRRICRKQDKTPVTYLGKTIQNEMINLIGNEIQKNILMDLNKAKYFSIIIDCTRDVSRVEQMTMIVRFVSLENKPRVREHFIGFIPVVETSGSGLTTAILQEFEKLGLKIQNLRGQGYDNGSNMKGKNSGVQKRIIELNPRALFVPCSCHSLNLVVKDAVESSNEATSFFAIVQALYVFFSGSPQRWAILKENVKDAPLKLLLKPLCTTRWESRINAIRPLRYQLYDVCKSLVAISSDNSHSDKESRQEADNLLVKINDFSFIFTLIVWHDILNQINAVSKQLQSIDMDVCSALKSLEKIREYFRICRSDEIFLERKEQAITIATKLNVPTDFDSSENKRIRRIKRMFEYEAADEPITDAETHFKVNLYYTVIDRSLQEIEERFVQLSQFNELFSFVNNMHTKHSTDLLGKCTKLQEKFTFEGQSDIIAIELYDELCSLRNYVDKVMSPIELLDYLCVNNLLSVFPSTAIVLRLLLTAPVTVASAERSFSKLKLIKNYLRSTMSQERLSSLAIISVESEIGESLDYDNMLTAFAKAKARKINF